MAIRKLPYREVQERIRYYAPARYLCGLTETRGPRRGEGPFRGGADWTPDFTTVQDFAQLMGEDGVRLINEAVVEQAVALGLADPRVAVADTTAQEAAIPHPNEMGLLASFVRAVQSAAGKAGQAIRRFVGVPHPTRRHPTGCEGCGQAEVGPGAGPQVPPVREDQGGQGSPS
jgi:hypothetical protein